MPAKGDLVGCLVLLQSSSRWLSYK